MVKLKKPRFFRSEQAGFCCLCLVDAAGDDAVGYEHLIADGIGHGIGHDKVDASAAHRCIKAFLGIIDAYIGMHPAMGYQNGKLDGGDVKRWY